MVDHSTNIINLRPDEPPSQEPDSRHFKPKLRSRNKWLLLWVLALALGAGYLLLTKNAQPFPPDIVQTAKFPLFYPGQLPNGFRVVPDSFHSTASVVFFSIEYGPNKRLVLTEQLKPVNYDFEQLKGDRQFNTSFGQGIIKVKDQTTNASLITDRTWILVNAPQQVSTDDVEFIIKHLKLAKH